MGHRTRGFTHRGYHRIEPHVSVTVGSPRGIRIHRWRQDGPLLSIGHNTRTDLNLPATFSKVTISLAASA